MMKNLLCWCICLLVAGDRWSVTGTETFENTGASHVRQNTQRPQSTDHRPQATDHLPCSNSSPDCLQRLGDLAVQNGRALLVLKEAIRLQKKNRWTTWLSADGLHPLGIALRIARNIAGGGERAGLQLELSRLELRHAELESTLRQAVSHAVLEAETAQRQCTEAENKLATHQARLAFISVAYRLGEGSTEAMLQLWQTETELQHDVERARLHRTQCQRQLQALVFPFVEP